MPGRVLEVPDLLGQKELLTEAAVEMRLARPDAPESRRNRDSLIWLVVHPPAFFEAEHDAGLPRRSTRS